MMKHLIITAAFMAAIVSAPAATKPIRALLVTGGCCHDYPRQMAIIPEGISGLANVEWTVVKEGGTGTKYKEIEKSVFNKPDWSKDFDVVVHNECFADDADPVFIEKFLAPHRAGLPAVVVHCAMHTFRASKTDDFRQFLGVSSFGHGPAHPFDVVALQETHPVMKGFKNNWTTPDNEELYHIKKLWPAATALAQAKENDGKDHVVVWVNTYGKGRVFGTTLAHSNKTMQAPVFAGLMTRGLLWACDKLDDSGLAKPGYEAPVKK